MTFLDHLRDLMGRTPPSEIEKQRKRMLQGLAGLMDDPCAPVLIELLEGLHAEDYRALRIASDGPAADKIRGQAARTDELLDILRGASAPVVANQRKRR